MSESINNFIQDTAANQIKVNWENQKQQKGARHPHEEHLWHGWIIL